MKKPDLQKHDGKIRHVLARELTHGEAGLLGHVHWGRWHVAEQVLQLRDGCPRVRGVLRACATTQRIVGIAAVYTFA